MSWAVVIPNMNGERYLRNAILSAHAAHADTVIVADGGSTDSSWEITKQLGCVWIPGPDRGQWEGVCKGVSVADAEFVIWLNADDILLPGVAYQAEELFLDQRVVGIYGDFVSIDSAGRFLSHHATPTKVDVRTLIERQYNPLGPVIIFRRQAWAQAGPISGTYHDAMDYEAWIGLASVGDIVKHPALLSCFRLHERSKTTTFARRQIWESRAIAEGVRAKTSIRSLAWSYWRVRVDARMALKAFRSKQ